MKQKFLIIRFSSIGDIVFTTPVIRCLRKRYADAEIHFLTKPENKIIVESNPNIDKVLLLKKSLFETISELKKEHYTAVIDLHKNLRTFAIKQLLFTKNYSFNKLNLEKEILIHFHYNLLPQNLHITERNLAAVAALGVEDDGEGMDYFIAPQHKVDIEKLGLVNGNFIAWVIGAKHFTKVLPTEKVIESIRLFQQKIPDRKVVLLGGREDVAMAENIVSNFTESVVNTCGKFNLSESVSILNQSKIVISGDTGLLHIAVALGKPVVAIFGSTVPEFGVFPKYGKFKIQPSAIIEMKDLDCRPCTKFGRNSCPKGHFLCMKGIESQRIFAAVKNILNDLEK